MNAFKRFLMFLILPAVFAGVMSCEKEENPQASDGPPVVHYIRSTDPALSDSLLVGTFMGSLIAIVGDNLGETRELWFNDQRATLNPTYVTKKSILVNVPSTVPVVVNNKIRFVFADGSELLHDFSVNVPAPTLSGIKSEYVPDGGTVVLDGDFFFEPKVFFRRQCRGRHRFLYQNADRSPRACRRHARADFGKNNVWHGQIEVFLPRQPQYPARLRQ